MFSRPVSSSWNPAPTSRSGSTRPQTRASPSVGTVIPEMTWVSVDLPDPFGPTMPKKEPRGTSKVTPSSALKPAIGTWRHGRTARDSERCSVSSCPRRYVLVTETHSIASSDEVGKAHLQPREDHPAACREDDRPRHRDADDPPLGVRHVQKGPAPRLDESGDRVERQQDVDVLRRSVHRVADRSDEDPCLDQQREHGHDVAETCRERTE